MLTNEELANMFEIRRYLGDDENGKMMFGKVIPAKEVLRKLDLADAAELTEKMKYEADRATPSIKEAGAPGSKERIEAMAAHFETSEESCFDITDEEIAERVSSLLGVSQTSRYRATDMRE